DMGVVAEVADRVMVMHRGDKVEENDSDALFGDPRHPYTRALLSAVPRLGSMKGSDQPAPFALLDMAQKGGAPMQAAPQARTARYDQDPLLKVDKMTTRFDI